MYIYIYKVRHPLCVIKITRSMSYVYMSSKHNYIYIYIHTLKSLAVKFRILWHTPHKKKTENLIIIFTHYRPLTLTDFNTIELSVLRIYMLTDNF